MKNKLRGIIVSGIALAILVTAAAAQDRSASADRLGALTAAVAQRAKGRQFDSAFRRIAAERHELMLKLAETDPAAVIRNSLPAETLGMMPAEIAGMFERHGTFTGELEVLAECEEYDGRTHRFLKASGKQYRVYLDGDSDLLTGAKVEADGVLIGDALVLAAGGIKSTQLFIDSSGTGTSSVLAGTTGEIKVREQTTRGTVKRTDQAKIDFDRAVDPESRIGYGSDLTKKFEAAQ